MTSPRRRVAQLLGRYWTLFAVAFLAMLVEAAASLAEPWPLKVIFDYVLDDKEPPRWLGHWLAGQANDLALVNVVALSVIAIALVGAVASYTQKYLSTTVGKKVGYDLRRILYHHVQRLSLAFYDERRTGDLVVRLTKDIDAAEDFISSAILGIVTQRHHAPLHGRGHVLPRLALQPHRAVHCAHPVPGSLPVHPTHQAGDPGRQEQGK